MTHPSPLDFSWVHGIVRAALAEDVGEGDVTTTSTVDPRSRAVARFVAREELVVCGLPLARAVFSALDGAVQWQPGIEDGERVPAGGLVASLSGSAATILTGERTALNFLQRLSGIATLTRRAVTEIEGTRSAILDTRKTTPTLRRLEKYAVRMGGGMNHRAGLFDAVLIKDNHVALAGGVAEAISRAERAGHEPGSIAVEVDDLSGLLEALDAGAGRVLLDNFTPTGVARAVEMTAGRARIEVSGGLRVGSLRPFAEAGADYLSLGCLTHSAPAVDISLELAPQP